MSDPPGPSRGAKTMLSRAGLALRYSDVRDRTRLLCAPLTAEDCAIQSMPDVSPTKWHLAHTTWFFEAFVLGHFIRDYEPVRPEYAFLFNSYYITVGAMHTRDRRGLLSRPSLDDVYAYRCEVDARVADLIDSGSEADRAELASRVELGLHHEQQHQELLLMDIKHVFSCNPLYPSYRSSGPLETLEAPTLRFVEHPGGIVDIGFAAKGFCYDNERPRHQVVLAPFEIANRCVTNREVAEFIAEAGYERPELWLSDGWATVQRERWKAPLYWRRDSDEWLEFRLAGLQPIDPNAPVVHVSYYEADAFARWAGHRLPGEAEWEVVAANAPIAGNFVDSGHLHPRPARDAEPVSQLFGDVWELTRSPYAPYPAFEPLSGSLGEYNGKFMANQFVSRGGCCATTQSHMRATYRNFYYPHQRWAFQGFRLARYA